MKAASDKRNRAFSLIELVIVVVIIGIIGAIAIPRMSRGAGGASESALVANLSVLRNAIDLYATEHGGQFPTVANIQAQLTQFTDDAGGTSSTKTTTHIYGPYLRAVPPMPIASAHKGDTGIAASDGAGVGWIYTESTGAISANAVDEMGTPITDDTGTAYTSY